MKILGISHIGIVPKNISQTEDFFDLLMDVSKEGSETVADQGVEVHFYKPNTSDTRLELLSPVGENSPITKFLETKGSGIQHLALKVDSVEEWISYLQQKGITMIDTVARRGAHHTQIAFVHPKSTGGILIELTQE